MASYLVIYVANSPAAVTPGREPTGLLNSIRDFTSWNRLSHSTYAIVTHLGPEDVFHHLAADAGADDRLYIMGLDGKTAGFGPEDVNDWLRQHVRQDNKN
ncbi:MAG: hypothetical protein GKR94_24800 [Gammaproteobacteria bacterium]|nr:hypothetical protein [Gammaproteobacteria bacterium]